MRYRVKVRCKSADDGIVGAPVLDRDKLIGSESVEVSGRRRIQWLVLGVCAVCFVAVAQMVTGCAPWEWLRNGLCAVADIWGKLSAAWVEMAGSTAASDSVSSGSAAAMGEELVGLALKLGRIIATGVILIGVAIIGIAWHVEDSEARLRGEVCVGVGVFVFLLSLSFSMALYAYY